MAEEHSVGSWPPGEAPVAVVMIAQNEGHNMEAVLKNLAGWAQEVFVVDSYSSDETVDIALRYGVHVVQRPFDDFGSQWNFALEYFPIRAPWSMKLDPDERLTKSLKQEIKASVSHTANRAFTVSIRLFFMERPLPVRLRLLRLWRTGAAAMSNVLVNEHLRVDGAVGRLEREIEHHDSPDLDHWLHKQNRYTTAEALASYIGQELAEQPKILGNSLQRRMWIKKNFGRVPFRFTGLFLYHWLVQGAWKAGWVGYAWSRLRCDVIRLVEYKRREMEITGRVPEQRPYGPGQPDPRVTQCK